MALKASVKKGDLVKISDEALTYSLANSNFYQITNLLGIVLKTVKERQDADKMVNFDNAALYYVMTGKGFLSVFEFDLEVINETE
jgi:predicted nucleic acid-binding protein